MNQIEFSIVIPTYNEEKHIAQTLKSIRQIKSKNYEIIVSDGRSTDRTVKIAEKYADKVVIEPKRNTIASGRNFGVKYAVGDIIISMDADVRIPHPHKFFDTIRRALKDKKVVGAMTTIKVFPEERKLEDVIAMRVINDTVRLVNHFGSFIGWGSCQIMKRDAFNKVGGYNENIVSGEDANMYYKLAKIGKIKFLKHLEVDTSPRRFRKKGYMLMLLMDYLPNGLSLLFRGKSLSKEWTPVR